MNPFMAMVIGALLGFKRAGPIGKKVQVVSPDQRRYTAPGKFSYQVAFKRVI
jgi:hypothetical protein